MLTVRNFIKISFGAYIYSLFFFFSGGGGGGYPVYYYIPSSDPGENGFLQIFDQNRPPGAILQKKNKKIQKKILKIFLKIEIKQI